MQIFLFLFLSGLALSGRAQQPAALITIKDPSFRSGRGLQEGIAAYDAAAFRYLQPGKTVLNIRMKAPVVISVASKPEKWGFFQFPNIDRTAGGAIVAKWNLANDAIEAYGTDTQGTAVSTDGGMSWRSEPTEEPGNAVLLPNGDRLAIYTPKPVPVKELQLLEPVGIGHENYRKSNLTFYRLHELPESRQGVCFKRLKKGGSKWEVEKATLDDPQAARYSLAGLVPIVWWGDIKVAKDGALVAGIYPGFLIDENGVTDPRSGAFFYRSTDNGHHWSILGRIPFRLDAAGDSVSAKRMGFTEPAFEILRDGTFLCVLRTTDGAGIGPMYGSYSKDQGKTWSKPRVITPAGVLPRLLKLSNGVLVLASGRPGVQLRFSTDARGMQWSRAFEMLPHDNDFRKELNGGSAQVSCGYTGLLPTGPDKFLIIYSDFHYQATGGAVRKAIKVREVTVDKK
ncbi:glycoside hydrolase [Niabella sp. 3A5MI-3]|nr:sialidase family protein [Niabella beijingensis]MBZ4190888.1 glycoside hydrolase [Niabella beijingensis]